MAEFIAVVGLVSSIVQLVDFGNKIMNRMNEFKSAVSDVPKVFQDIITVLPLLLNILKQMREQAEQGNISEDTKAALLPVIDGCRTQVELLYNTLNKTLSKKGETAWERGRKAFSSIRQESEVQKITMTIHRYTQVLTFHQATSFTSSLPQRDVSYEIQADIGKVAILFEACQVEVENVQQKEDFDTESEQILAYFKTAEALFKRWARITGILEQSASGNILQNLEDKQTHSAICDTLNCLQNVFNETKETAGSLQLKIISEGINTNHGMGKIWDPDELSNTTYRQQKFNRNPLDKPKFAKQVELFGAFVERLYTLAHVNFEGSDTSADMANQLADFQKFLTGQVPYI
jgi:hypothetical protein